MSKKVVLAFSGGLDTSYCAKYLSETLGYEVHAVTINTGGLDKNCVNYEILMMKERKNCLCTGMLYDPKWEEKKNKNQQEKVDEQPLFSKFKKIKKLLWKK